MGRPATGHIELLPSGQFRASVPERRGSTRRIRHKFHSRDAAETWIVIALAALEAGKPIPEPVPEVHWFTELCYAWHNLNYEQYQKAQPHRSTVVLRHINLHILPWFTKRWPTPQSAADSDCHTFMLRLAGRCLDDGTSTVGDPTAQRQAALREDTAGDIRKVLVQALEFGVAGGILPRNVATTCWAAEPLPSSILRAKPQVNHITLAETRRLVGEMHVFHLLEVWIQRLIGVRVGEGFGLRVGSVIPDPDGYATVAIDSQGGRVYQSWSPTGGREHMSHIQRLKNLVSYRILVFPPTLVRLIMAIEEAFYILPDGTRLDGLPLIPSFKRPGEGSIDTYGQAIKVAAKRADLSATLSSQDLRKALSTDVKGLDLDEFHQRRYLGHAAGTDVHARVYLLDDPRLRGVREVAEQVEALIQKEGVDIFTLTERMPQFFRGHQLYSHLKHAQDVLEQSGLFVTNRPGFTVAEVAERIGLSETAARRRVQQGVIVGRKRRNVAGYEEWIVSPADLDEFIAKYAGFRTVDEVAEETGLTYTQVYRLLPRLAVTALTDDVSGCLMVDESGVHAVRSEVDRVDALRERAVTVSEAAEILGRTPRTVRTWIGVHLVEEPEGDSAERLYVTRASVEEYRAKLSTTKRGSRRPSRFV
jgi:predicted transcriptional regulator/integrase